MNLNTKGVECAVATTSAQEPGDAIAVVIGDVQPLDGYRAPLADPVVQDLNALSDPQRAQYSRDMIRVGDALMSDVCVLDQLRNSWKRRTCASYLAACQPSGKIRLSQTPFVGNDVAQVKRAIR